MLRSLLLFLAIAASAAFAQPQQPQRQPQAPAATPAVRAPTPEEQAFARLPADLQAMLEHLPPAEALRKVELARQNLIALGVPQPTHEQLVATVQRVLEPPAEGYAVEGASAGATTFPPLSPLVSPYGQ